MSSIRNNTIDLIKTICIIFVIICHSTLGLENSESIITMLVLNSAVPIFMFISGYLFSQSYEKNVIENKQSILIWIFNKIVRFAIPYIIIFILEYVISYFFTTSKYVKNVNMLLAFITGGFGPGSYYFPIMVEFVLAFPFLYKISSRNKRGLIYVFVANFLYELIKTAIHLDASIYRLLIFRYLFVIAYGIYEHDNNKENNKIKITLSLTGLLYITMIQTKTINPFIFNQWTSTCMISSLFWIPLISIIIKKVKLKTNCFTRIGKSSFNIFLLQMMFYFFDFSKLYSNIGIVYQTIINIIICVVLGYIFYEIENRITNKLFIK